MRNDAARAYLAGVVQSIDSESARIVCPYCNGGNDKEASLVLTLRDGVAYFCCHRASCGEAGVLGGPPRDSNEALPKRRKHEPYLGNILPVSFLHPAAERWRKAPRGPWCATTRQIGLFTDGNGAEVWTLRNIAGVTQGVQVRRNLPEGKKRVRTFKNHDDDRPMYHALLCPPVGEAPASPCWIVEDPLSAAVVRSWNMSAVSLLGTHMSNTLANIIDCTPAREFLVALDPGAEKDQALAIRALQAYTTRPVRGVWLKRDIKNMTADDLVDLFYEVRYT